MKKCILLLLTFFVLYSCQQKNKSVLKSPAKHRKHNSESLQHKSLPLVISAKSDNDSIFSNDEAFIRKVLLKERFHIQLSSYDTIRYDNCLPEKLSKQKLIEGFEGIKELGDLDKDGKNDYAFVLQPINRCEEGQSYYFSNPKIPRLYTDSFCCHPESLFSIGDIDEDGSTEIAEYYSSCASRYKAITIWTLKHLRWKEVKTFSFVLNDEYKVFADFRKLHKKVAKNTFKFLEISDVTVQGEVVKKWHTVTMK